MSEELIRFACACGKHLKAPASAVGRTFKCPACGKTVVCPAPAETAPVAEAEHPQQPAEVRLSPETEATLRKQAEMVSLWDRLTIDTPQTYWLWIAAGGGFGCLVPLGILLSVTVIGACLGVPMAAIGGGAGGFGIMLLIWRYVRKQNLEKSRQAAEKPVTK